MAGRKLIDRHLASACAIALSFIDRKPDMPQHMMRSSILSDGCTPQPIFLLAVQRRQVAILAVWPKARIAVNQARLCVSFCISLHAVFAVPSESAAARAPDAGAALER